MKKKMWMVAAVLGLALILTGVAAAQEKPKAATVNLKVLPPVVLKAFQAAYPNAVIKGASKETEKGATQYEVESMDGALNRDLLYAADGKILEIEESTAPENLPAPVKQILAKDYAGAKILRAEILTKAGVKSFELAIELKGKKMEVTIDPQGKIVK
ncbi:MAG: PepSY-like domain-containing protein [Acidobacteriota bacterium]|nr:PepSY-like domain-containing protein [Acidobacteriota bacterium]